MATAKQQSVPAALVAFRAALAAEMESRTKAAFAPGLPAAVGRVGHALAGRTGLPLAECANELAELVRLMGYPCAEPELPVDDDDDEIACRSGVCIVYNNTTHVYSHSGYAVCADDTDPDNDEMHIGRADTIRAATLPEIETMLGGMSTVVMGYVVEKMGYSPKTKNDDDDY